MIERIGERMVNKMKLVNRERNVNKRYKNIREFPTYSELYGMMQMLETMDMEYEIEFNPENTDEMTAIIIMGLKFEV